MVIWRWLSRLGRPRLTTFTLHNCRSSQIEFWLEPWAAQFTLPSGSRLDLILTGSFRRPLEAPVELTEDEFVYFAPGGALVSVAIDGELQDSVSSTLQAPDAGELGTRDFVHLVFDRFPGARSPGAVLGLMTELGEPMQEGDLNLEPLTEAHRSDLKAACAEDPDIWLIYAISYDPEHFDPSFDALIARSNGRAFAILVGGRLIGMSCYIGIEEQRGVLEIGNTYYIPEMRGTGLNRRVKDLIIGRAVDCGFRRIEFRVDSRNARSQAAMAKLGAVREGVIRAERITWTGHVRDTVLFSILADEWRTDGAR